MIGVGPTPAALQPADERSFVFYDNNRRIVHVHTFASCVGVPPLREVEIETSARRYADRLRKSAAQLHCIQVDPDDLRASKARRVNAKQRTLETET